MKIKNDPTVLIETLTEQIIIINIITKINVNYLCPFIYVVIFKGNPGQL